MSNVNRPMSNLMIKALLGVTSNTSEYELLWPKTRQIHALMARGLAWQGHLQRVKVPSVKGRVSTTYKFRLTEKGFRIRRELNRLSDYTIKNIVPHVSRIRRKEP